MGDARMQTAAVVAVGTELTAGLRVDTNTAEIARKLAPRGFVVLESVLCPDSVDVLAAEFLRLSDAYSLVVVTGGLGPTHDDVTREAAARAFDLPLVSDELHTTASRLAGHLDDSRALEGFFNQSLCLKGAEILAAQTGTASGQVLRVGEGTVVFLPGPPTEMRPMLDAWLQRFPLVRTRPIELGVVGKGESDAQAAASRVLESHTGIIFTVLAYPGDVRLLLLDDGADQSGMESAAAEIADALGKACYTRTGKSLGEELVCALRANGLTVACAESCTGGMVSAAITDVPGASEVFLGGVVTYSNEAKQRILGVDAALLAEHGAVSEQTALSMAEGGRRMFGADIAVSVTGIAGPGGGSVEKPVGLVWMAVSSTWGASASKNLFAKGSRESVRQRATSAALDLLRCEALGMRR
ncbi:MAG: nicotinamide-nucleotide amidohydrolase family protein [Coriobacteriia bacterium]|nr:nicotinamide-nucleotide amidohydrolase family protein [Coriobacteriia bacterium]